MPLKLGTTPSAGSSVAYVFSSQFGLVPDSAADQTTQLQAFLDYLCAGTTGGTRVGYLLPGTYRKSAELTLANTNANRPIVLRGGGGRDQNSAPTVILDTVDAGAGKYSLKPTGSATVTIEGISFYAPTSSHGPGDMAWLQRGIKLSTRTYLRDVSVSYYAAGVAIASDHLTIRDCQFTGNAYNVEVLPGMSTQGDILFDGVAMGSASRACIAVARSSTLGGARFQDVQCGLSPYVVLRYDDASGVTLAGGFWLNGVSFTGSVSTEYTGNGIVYDAVRDGVGVNDVIFDHGVANTALYNAQQAWAGKPQNAAWDLGGPMVDVRFLNRMPSSTTTQPSMIATTFTRVIGERADYLPTLLIAGHRVYSASTSGGSAIVGCYVGNARGRGSILIEPAMLNNGSVARGELLTNYNQLDVVKYSGPAAGKAKAVMGVAAHDATAGTVVHCYRAGNTSETVVKNTSGLTIATGDLLVPHASGGVASAGAGNAGQIMGRLSGSALADGSLGQADLTIASPAGASTGAISGSASVTERHQIGVDRAPLYAGPGAAGANSPTLNNLMLYACYAEVAMTIGLLSVRTNATATSAAWRLGVYQITSQSDPFAYTSGTAWATLLQDAGAIDCSVSAGFKTIAVNVTVAAGTWFAIGAVAQGAAVSTETANALSVTPLSKGGTESPLKAAAAGLVMTGQSGALPSTFTPSTVTTSIYATYRRTA